MKYLFVPIILILLSTTSCGYVLHSNFNPWQDPYGVKSLYIRPVKNNSLRAGAEVVFMSALMKVFSRSARVRMVTNESQADAFVESTIDNIASEISSRTTVPQLTDDPLAQDLNDTLIATEYSAKAQITVRLIGNSEKYKGQLWSQSFSTSKIYPGNNRFGLEGNTSALINDSQMQLSLQEIAQNLARDAYDTMFEVF